MRAVAGVWCWRGGRAAIADGASGGGLGRISEMAESCRIASEVYGIGGGGGALHALGAGGVCYGSAADDACAYGGHAPGGANCDGVADGCLLRNWGRRLGMAGGAGGGGGGAGGGIWRLSGAGQGW